MCYLMRRSLCVWGIPALACVGGLVCGVGVGGKGLGLVVPGW
jgi:hypothetical protein